MNGVGDPLLGLGVKPEDLGGLVPRKHEEVVCPSRRVPKGVPLLNVVQDGVKVPAGSLLAHLWGVPELKDAVVVVAGRELRDEVEICPAAFGDPHPGLPLLKKGDEEPLGGVHQAPGAVSRAQEGLWHLVHEAIGKPNTQVL